MSGTAVAMVLSAPESAHLSSLFTQFAELLSTEYAEDAAGDPALARLTPAAYTDDPEADADFRRLTSDDLLDRRRDDVATVLTSLVNAGATPPAEDKSASREDVHLNLRTHEAQSWLRALSALRLVLATRLGIADSDQAHTDDPRAGLYEWLGYRLDVLVHAMDEATTPSA